jgi:hypothetical protein
MQMTWGGGPSPPTPRRTKKPNKGEATTKEADNGKWPDAKVAGSKGSDSRPAESEGYEKKQQQQQPQPRHEAPRTLPKAGLLRLVPEECTKAAGGASASCCGTKFNSI